MKNRFYYSFSQDCVCRSLGEFDDKFNRIEGIRENYVLTPNGWERYSEWCSQENSKCNWEDAKLVFETDEEPKIKIEYRKTTILQAKEIELALIKEQLAITEKALELACETIKSMCPKPLWIGGTIPAPEVKDAEYFMQIAKELQDAN